MEETSLRENLKKKGIFTFERGNKLILFNPYNLKKVFTTKENFEKDLEKNFNLIIRKNEISKPVLSNIKVIISTGCNFRCEYCLVYKNRKRVPSSKMSIEMAGKVIDFYNDKIKNGVILFTGGEPLTNWQTVEYFLDNVDAKFIIQTNGSLINERIAKKLKEKNVLIVLSLDGDTKSKNSMRKLLNGEEAYESILSGYNNAKKAGCTVGASVVAGDYNVSSLYDMTKNLRDKLKVDSFGYNIPHFTKYNDSEVDIEKYTDELIKIFYYAKKEKIYIDQIARKLKPLIFETFRIMDCTAGGEQILIYPDGSTTNCVNYPPFNNKSYNYDRWVKQTPIHRRYCKNCEAIGICGGGCLFDGIKRYKEGLDLRNCYFTKKVLEEFLWDMYDELEKCEFNYEKMIEAYAGVIGYNSAAGVSAGHETTNLSISELKRNIKIGSE